MLFNKNKQVFNIEGMHCEHCAKTVETKISTIPEVKKVKVNLNKKCATIVSSKEITKEEVSRALNETDFKVV